MDARIEFDIMDD